MDTFAFREAIIAEFERCSRSFARFCATVIFVTKERVLNRAPIYLPAQHSEDYPA